MFIRGGGCTEQGEGGNRGRQNGGGEGAKQCEGRMAMAGKAFGDHVYWASGYETQVYLPMWHQKIDTAIHETKPTPKSL